MGLESRAFRAGMFCEGAIQPYTKKLPVTHSGLANFCFFLVTFLFFSILESAPPLKFPSLGQILLILLPRDFSFLKTNKQKQKNPKKQSMIPLSLEKTESWLY